MSDQKDKKELQEIAKTVKEVKDALEQVRSAQDQSALNQTTLTLIVQQLANNALNQSNNPPNQPKNEGFWNFEFQKWKAKDWLSFVLLAITLGTGAGAIYQFMSQKDSFENTLKVETKKIHSSIDTLRDSTKSLRVSVDTLKFIVPYMKRLSDDYRWITYINNNPKFSSTQKAQIVNDSLNRYFREQEAVKLKNKHKQTGYVKKDGQPPQSLH